ncbi:hypothetical protein HY492_00335 [Candidatus Woesearchaeota archaeon]|nr:hypothetical protein [Candidatus Woesearchaeota archaeon]
MKLERKESKIKPEFKIADGYLDLKTLDTGVLVAHLEAEIKRREMSIEKRRTLI